MQIDGVEYKTAALIRLHACVTVLCFCSREKWILRFKSLTKHVALELFVERLPSQLNKLPCGPQNGDVNG